jgi:starch synthase
MRVSIMSKEWPPEIYGGAGVHVDQLVPQLRRLVEVDVQCFGAPRPDALAHATPAELATANAALQTLGVDLAMAQAAAGADLVHSHTWYANMGGHLASLLHGIPHVITAHSLEPLRPWKAEQLGGGYRVSSWAEATAYEAAAGIIAVSNGMRNDVLSAYPKVDPDRVYVVHNGIDTQVYTPTQDEEVLRRFGIATDRPFVLFVGRITRQKGLPHLLRAVRLMNEQAQLVLCASSPDTPELGQEVRDGVAALRAEHGDDSVIWIEEMVSKQDVIVLYSQAAVFVCPSVYEPLGIVNLEAMACGTAVVASDVGGIPEVVDNGNTGFLAHYDPQATDAFEAELASALDRVVADPAMAAKMGADGRIRADEYFGWDAIAAKTVDVYRAVSGA